MGTVGLFGVSFGGVSRQEGWSAPGRSAYQMGVEYPDGIPVAKRRGGETVVHMQHWLMLPDGVDPSIWSREAIWEAARQAETRRDAREGRFFDIAWPRQLPTDRIGQFVGDLYAPFAVMGLAVQVDWETSLAADGQPNDHLHGLISTRALTNAGFAAGKCRELDVWFRSDVRRHVAGLFDSIAETYGIDVRFDPRPNVEREDTLPPEDHLPRRIVRNRLAAGATKMLDRRDAQRNLREEHDAIVDRIEKLHEERKSLLAALETELDNMAVLTSWQHVGQEIKPLAVEIAMTAIMGRGVAVDRHRSVDGLGLALVVGRTVIIDNGNRILIEGPLDDDAVRTLHVLAGHKAWRDLSLVDWSGMPTPVPPDPMRPAVERMTSPRVVEQSKLYRRSKHHLIIAAEEIVQNLKAASSLERSAILERVLGWGNPHLERMVAQLVAHAERQSSGPISAKSVVHMMDQSLNGDADLWYAYRLEQDLVAMTTPGNALSRPFQPHPRFYEYFGVQDGADHGYRAGSEEGAGR